MLKNARGVIWLAAGLAISASAATAQTVRYVDDDAPPGGDGTSWATAFNSIQAALAVAAPGDEVRVAHGIYRPAPPGGSRTATFLVPNGVAFRGGYAGIGAPDPDLRDPSTFVTVLSGDLNQDDTDTLGNRTDNSHHVVTTAANASSATLVEGFLITAGNADASSNRCGGGLFVPSGSPTIAACTFYRNQANETSGGGGALASFSPQAVTILNCTFVENSSRFPFNTVQGMGGAVFADRAIITGCIFTRNRGNQGGAINLASSGVLTDCVIFGNDASQGGAVQLGGVAGASYIIERCKFDSNTASRGGAVEIYNGFASVHFTDCVFTGNTAETFGGGILGLSSGMSATRCIFSGNSAVSGGGAICTAAGMAQITNCTIAYNTSAGSAGGVLLTASNSTPSLRNCILWGNSDATGETEAAQIARYFATGTFPVVNYCDVMGLTPELGGVGNFDADPLFANPLKGDFSLQFGSPCVDAGDPNPIYNDPDGSRNDLGAVRVQNAKPTAEAVVTQLTSVGDTAIIRLDASGSADPESPADELGVEWYVDGTLVCSGDFATCGTINIPVSYGDHTVQLVITDPGAAFDEDVKSITVSPASLALFQATMADVDFHRGDFRIQGEIALPSTVGASELQNILAASLEIGGVTAVAPAAYAFHVGRGCSDTVWTYWGGCGQGQIQRFDIDWGGATFRYRKSNFHVELASDTITSDESILVMDYNYRRTGAFTLTVGPAVINVASDGTVTANVPVSVLQRSKEVAITLPFPITESTTFVFSGGVSKAVVAADYLRYTTGRFRVDGSFNPALFPAGSATMPREVKFDILVGAQGYPGQLLLDASDLNVRNRKWMSR